MSRGKRLISLLTLCVAAIAVVAIVLATRSPAEAVLHTSAADSLRVRGNRLVYGPGAGRVVQLRGINRSGSEYKCETGNGKFFDSPYPREADSGAMIQEMANWDINVVRLPLNEGCWLGTNNQPGSDGPAYQKAIEAEVRALNAHGLFVILALQWNAAGSQYAGSPLPMADASNSPRLWRQVARAFKADGLVMFDLFNEPHNISWNCWLNGCTVPVTKFNTYPFKAAGMQSLINAVRSTGARQPLIISGNDYSRDISQIYSHMPRDPDHALVFAVHTYGGNSPCVGACLTTSIDAAKHFPIVYTEFGEIDCGGGYIDAQMPVLDRHGIGYLAWAWDSTASGWSCTQGPALVDNYGGTPTAYGAAFKAHLLALGEPVRP